MAKQTSQIYEIERPESVIVPPTRISVPSGEGVIAFAHPFAGHGTYQDVGRSILRNETADLSLPTGEQTMQFLHASYCGPEKFTKQDEPSELRKVMGGNYVWVFDRKLWTSEGVYGAFDPKAEGLSRILGVEELETALSGGRELENGVRYSENGEYSFAPKESYTLGEHTPESFAKDGLVVITFGEDGAELAGEVSKKFNKNPRTWGLNVNEGDEPIQNCSAVYDSDGRLSLNGCYLDYNWDGFSSGVFS
jgi:hypothetical protein